MYSDKEQQCHPTNDSQLPIRRSPRGSSLIDSYVTLSTINHENSYGWILAEVDCGVGSRPMFPPPLTYHR